MDIYDNMKLVYIYSICSHEYLHEKILQYNYTSEYKARLMFVITYSCPIYSAVFLLLLATLEILKIFLFGTGFLNNAVTIHPWFGTYRRW